MVVNDLNTIIRLAIDIWSSLMVHEKYHLSSREKEYFIGVILAYHKGVNLKGSDFVKYMVNEYKYSKNEQLVLNMRTTIKNKKWIMQTTTGYDIPTLFKQDLKSLSISLKIGLSGK